MRPLDDEMLDPEFAELAVLLAEERPLPDPEFIRVLDARVARGFEPAGAGGGASRRRLRLTWKTGAGSLAAGVAAAVAVVVIASGGGAGNSFQLDSGGTATTATPTVATSATRSPASSGSAERAPKLGASGAAGAQSGAAPAPPSNGRKIVQSAQLALTAAPSRVENVAQAVFDVIGRENGVVRRSNVTATGGLDSSAEFELSVPSSSLTATMSALSRLRDANVASRTDSTTDVNDRYVSLTRQLADARALRTGLLRQLAQAATQSEIDSLHARIRDAEASVASLESSLRSLGHAVSMSQITLTINAVVAPAGHSGGSSFTLGKAAHDAGRVLTVAAGVTLIALAVLVPITLAGALVAWVAAGVRRRRRERALDLA